jgi:hypothetical protein
VPLISLSFLDIYGAEKQNGAETIGQESTYQITIFQKASTTNAA